MQNELMPSSSSSSSSAKSTATSTAEAPLKKNKPSSRPHRVLVLQGGGALAAYEAGVFASLAERLSKKDKEDGRTGNMFDVVAGTSGGAINAALIVDHVVRNKTWDGVAKVPLAFWRATASDIALWPNNVFFKESWKSWEKAREYGIEFWKGIAESDMLKPFSSQREQAPFLPAYFLWPDTWGPLASEEAARRYWSWYLYSFGLFGIPGVLTPAIYQPDFKFGWNPSNYLVRYGNLPIVQTIKKFWNFERDRVKTTEDEPRLMFVSVDIRDGMTATFDSYPKKGDDDDDNKLKTVYEHELPDGKRERHTIYYQDGLGMEHLLTSMSSALRYVPPSLEAVTETISQEEVNGETKDKVLSSKKEARFFWDGFYLSNTPLREVLQAHRDYWSPKKKNDDGSSPGAGGPHERRTLKEIIESSVPDLEVYIVNMFPTLDKTDGYPRDPDAVNNRVNDVVYHDRTQFDEKIAGIVSDYVGLAKELAKIATNDSSDRARTEKKILQLLGERTLSKNRGGKQRTFDHLLDGRFRITKLVRIELSDDDRSDISGKVFDFSSPTIEYLIKQGMEDARRLPSI